MLLKFAMFNLYKLHLMLFIKIREREAKALLKPPILTLYRGLLKESLIFQKILDPIAGDLLYKSFKVAFKRYCIGGNLRLGISAFKCRRKPISSWKSTGRLCFTLSSQTKATW